MQAWRAVIDNSTQSIFQKLHGEVDRAAREMYGEADDFYEAGRFAEALELYQSLSVMRKLEVGPRSTRKMIEMRSSPTVRAAFRESDAGNLYYKAVEILYADPEPEECDDDLCEDCRLAKELEEAANDALEYPDQVAYVEPYSSPVAEDLALAADLSISQRVELVGILEELESRFPETERGQHAIEMLDVLRQDDALASAVNFARRTEEAKREYQMAYNFHLNGMKEKARPILEQIVEQYSDTEYAIKARILLMEE